MNVAAFIQARVGSTRLPSKVIMPLQDRTVLEHVVGRVRQSRLVEETIVVTTMNKQDLPIVRICAENEIRVFCGSESDVLDRFYQAAKLVDSRHIVRITGDCPMMDPDIIDRVVALHQEAGSDYTSNVIVERFPDGEDVEIFTFAALGRAWRDASLVSEREHVTPYLRKHPEIFKLSSLECETDLSMHRWTLDTQEDYEFIKKVYEGLYLEKKYFRMNDVLIFLDKNPDLTAVNAHIKRNEGYLKSLREDRRQKGG